MTNPINVVVYQNQPGQFSGDPAIIFPGISRNMQAAPTDTSGPFGGGDLNGTTNGHLRGQAGTGCGPWQQKTGNANGTGIVNPAVGGHP
jgi:hypothetical protein